jgi:glycosyltransferase involved in cell wall biosynthesis
LPEIVGRAGVVVNPDEARDIARGIKLTLNDQEKWRRLGPEQAKKFSWEKCARQTLKVLEEIKRENS